MFDKAKIQPENSPFFVVVIEGEDIHLVIGDVVRGRS